MRKILILYNVTLLLLLDKNNSISNYIHCISENENVTVSIDNARFYKVNNTSPLFSRPFIHRLI